MDGRNFGSESDLAFGGSMVGERELGGRKIITLTVLACAGALVAVLSGIWGRYLQVAEALEFGKTYDRYQASQASAADGGGADLARGRCARRRRWKSDRARPEARAGLRQAVTMPGRRRMRLRPHARRIAADRR